MGSFSIELIGRYSIKTQQADIRTTQLIDALSDPDSSRRLRAALTIGSNPLPDLVDALIERCAIEPDFYVRDMLTWALTRFPTETTVPALLSELSSDRAQAQSQALHTLSKIKDPDTWCAITRSLLHNRDREVAQSAWRAAVILVPSSDQGVLAEQLAEQFGRGNREMQLSLSHALVSLGGLAIEQILKKAMSSENPLIRAHATATQQLMSDPNAGFQLGIDQVKRILAP